MNETVQLGENLMALRSKKLSHNRKEMHMHLTIFLFLPSGNDIQTLAAYFLDYLADEFTCYCQRIFNGSQ